MACSSCLRPPPALEASVSPHGPSTGHLEGREFLAGWTALQGLRGSFGAQICGTPAITKCRAGTTCRAARPGAPTPVGSPQLPSRRKMPCVAGVGWASPPPWAVRSPSVLLNAEPGRPPKARGVEHLKHFSA